MTERRWQSCQRRSLIYTSKEQPMTEDVTTSEARVDSLPPTIRVRGEGMVEVAPDAAVIAVGVYVSKPSQKKAREEAAARAGSIITAVKDTGIPDRDIQTSGYSVSPQRRFDSKGKPIAIVGYDVRNTVTVTVRDLDQLAETLDAAMAASANEVSGPNFFIQYPEAAEDEARRLAMASARRRAEVLAGTEGRTLGAVRAIIDGESRSPAPRMARLYKMAAMETSTPVEAGTERITASVEVTWELV
jgi:uncharacterized protein YggE